MTLTVVWHDVVLIANPITWFTITIQYFIIHSDYQKMYSPLDGFVIPFPPYHISAKLYSPLYQICLFSVPPLKIHFPPTHRKNDRSLICHQFQPFSDVNIAENLADHKILHPILLAKISPKQIKKKVIASTKR